MLLMILMTRTPSSHGPEHDADAEAASDGDRLDLKNEFDAGMVSAFSEVFNNIAKHAYALAGAGDVLIQMQAEGSGMLLTVEDQGESFDISQVREPDLDALPENIDGVIREIEIGLVRNQGKSLGQAKRTGTEARKQWELV